MEKIKDGFLLGIGIFLASTTLNLLMYVLATLLFRPMTLQ